jgi:hypothetical protein
MNQELTQRLVKRFPILYQNYSSPMTQTCMCWGFEHGDGWFEIIWQLSLAIEAELNYPWHRKHWFLFKRKFFRRWNDFLYKLSPPQPDKHARVGSGTVSDPYRWVLVERAPRDWLARMIAKFFHEKDDGSQKWRTSIRRLGFKAFIKWPDTGLAVQQVKEKFGTLRFYCGGTEAIHRYIQLAERLSSITCEECREQGTANDSGWIRTLCEECRAPQESHR